MTTAAHATIKALAAAGGFGCDGDVMQAMGGRSLTAANVNDAIASSTSCEVCPMGYRLTSVDVHGDPIIIELRLEPAPVVLGLG